MRTRRSARHVAHTSTFNIFIYTGVKGPEGEVRTPHQEKGEKMRMRRSGFTPVGMALAAVVAISACDSMTGIESIDDPVLRDMALVAADAALEDVNTWAQPFGFGAPGAEMGRAMGGPGKAVGRAGGRRGLGHAGSGTVERTFYDAVGNEQAELDDLTTERIEVVTEVGGDVSRENWAASVYRVRTMTLTGLEGEETHRTVNGTGESKISRSRHTDEGNRSYEMTGSITYNDVVVPIPGSDPRYPISGTITHAMESTRTDADGTETKSMTMTITFDGDETASAVVNGESVEIDLTTREGRHPFRGSGGKSGG